MTPTLLIDIPSSRQLGQHWPHSVRESMRLIYASGRAGSLRKLSEEFGVPHDTLRRWCWQERWSELVDEIDTKVTQDFAEWLAFERQEHLKNVVQRARIIFDQFDALMEQGDKISPRQLCILSNVLEKADLLVRRNLPGAGCSI